MIYTDHHRDRHIRGRGIPSPQAVDLVRRVYRRDMSILLVTSGPVTNRTYTRPTRKLLFPVCLTSFSFRPAHTQLSGPIQAHPNELADMHVRQRRVSNQLTSGASSSRYAAEKVMAVEGSDGDHNT